MGVRRALIEGLWALLLGIVCAVAGPGGVARAQAPAPAPGTAAPIAPPPAFAGLRAFRPYSCYAL